MHAALQKLRIVCTLQFSGQSPHLHKASNKFTHPRPGGWFKCIKVSYPNLEILISQVCITLENARWGNIMKHVSRNVTGLTVLLNQNLHLSLLDVTTFDYSISSISESWVTGKLYHNTVSSVVYSWTEFLFFFIKGQFHSPLSVQQFFITTGQGFNFITHWLQ